MVRITLESSCLVCNVIDVAHRETIELLVETRDLTRPWSKGEMTIHWEMISTASPQWLMFTYHHQFEGFLYIFFESTCNAKGSTRVSVHSCNQKDTKKESESLGPASLEFPVDSMKVGFGKPQIRTNYTPYHRCMVYLPTFTININHLCIGKYTPRILWLLSKKSITTRSTVDMNPRDAS